MCNTKLILAFLTTKFSTFFYRFLKPSIQVATSSLPECPWKLKKITFVNHIKTLILGLKVSQKIYGLSSLFIYLSIRLSKSHVTESLWKQSFEVIFSWRTYVRTFRIWILQKQLMQNQEYASRDRKTDWQTTMLSEQLMEVAHTYFEEENFY